jgi:hypothetical protein
MMDWRMGWDSNPRNPRGFAGFQDRCLQPLGHPSYSQFLARRDVEIIAPHPTSVENTAIRMAQRVQRSWNH